MKPFPKLTLIGAGPGDPDLITVRGAKALAQADAVLYDALVHPDLLQLAPEKAVKLFVGKRAGQHSFKQDDINQLILDHALQYGHVVRLKGGDPFVFARGQEEIAFVEAQSRCNRCAGVAGSGACLSFAYMGLSAFV